jgi:hypothetical protein
MKLESGWKRRYGILKDYIASNPEIRIDPNEVCIPEDLRGRFYQYFDGIRGAMVESWSSAFGLDACSLSNNYIASANTLSATLNLNIELPLDLSSFLRTPKEGMMRLIYNRLFELVQGKISEDAFENLAAGDLAADATGMFRIGYETWAALALISLLEPDQIFGIALDGENMPLVTEIKEIAFGRQFHHPARRIPEFIFHSKKLNRYAAFKMPLAREVNSYQVPAEIPVQRLLRNRNGDTSSVLDHRMIFLSVVRNLKEIPIFADLHARAVSSPDLSIEFVMEQDLSNPEIIDQIKYRAEIMKPRFGGTIALMDSKPESEPLRIAANIDAVSVGLKPSGFQPVIEKLI